jgi:hypothetical protein
MKDFKQHIALFRSKLLNKENFAFARYSDGEMYILQNKELKLDQGQIKIGESLSYGPYKKADFKHYDPNVHGEFRDKLIEAFKYKINNYFVGISCRCCVGQESFNEQINLRGGDDEFTTWANLFVNSNYPIFVQEILPVLQTYDTVMICHEDANLEKLEFVTNNFRVGYNAMINDYHKIQDIKNWIKENNVTNKLFLFSASTFSNLAIYELYKDFPNNTYLDIGTCLTPFMNMPTERSYLQEYWFKAFGNDLNKTCIW